MADNNISSMSSRSEAIFGVTIAFFACATLFVTLRMLSRIWIVKKVSLDDYVILVAWLLASGLSFSICYAATVGLGRHEVDVPDFWQTPLRKAQYAFSVLYQTSLMAQKTSILLFYLSLSQTSKIFRWGTIATLFVVNAAGLALTLVTILECRPVSAVFQSPISANASCTDIITIYLSSTPVNIITDLAILFLPIPLLTSLRLPKKQKLVLVVTFGFWAFLAVVDVIRTAYLQSASSYRLAELHNDPPTGGNSGDVDNTDFSWNASFSFMWSAIEVNLGFVCACVPMLKPLVSRFMPHLLHDHGDRTTQKSHSATLDDAAAARLAALQRMPSIPSGEYEEKWDGGPTEAQEERELGMMDFLTTPDTNHEDMINRLRRSTTVLTNTSRDTPDGTPTFFDFVNMKGKKSMVQMNNRDSLFPVAMVTVLFFIWGFEYGLLNVLNQQFQAVAHMSAGQSVAIHSAYYAGYFVAPLTFGRLVLRHWGFKACYTVGLAIYACGTLIFWPAAVLTSFPTYVIVNFLVGMGLSVLEVAANPFIALCGPPQYAEIRLNLSQGFQAVGTVVAPLIASKAFTKYQNNAPSLIDTQWAYLGIALVTVLLALAYHYLPLPEATDEELEDASERVDGANNARVRGIRVVTVILGLGVLSQFCYVGSQETLGTTFTEYLGIVEPTFDTTDYTAIAHTLFALSRFSAAGLGFFITPRILLLFFYVGSIVFSALAMNFTGATATAMVLMVFFFEGPLFSLIFAQSLRGQGHHTKDASVLITAAIGGGAVFPAISYVARVARGPQYSLCVTVAAFATGTLLPIVLNALPFARKIVDPVKPSALGEGQQQQTGSVGSRASKPWSWFNVKRAGSKESGSTEWREHGNPE